MTLTPLLKGLCHWRSFRRVHYGNLPRLRLLQDPDVVVLQGAEG